MRAQQILLEIMYTILQVFKIFIKDSMKRLEEEIKRLDERR